MPAEEVGEVVKDYEAIFYNISITQHQDFKMCLQHVLKFLKKQGYPLKNTMVSYYSNLLSSYINCNIYPISNAIWLEWDDFEIVDE